MESDPLISWLVIAIVVVVVIVFVIIFIATMSLTVLTPVLVMLGLKKATDAQKQREVEQARLRAEGFEASATVVQLRDTGVRVNSSPRVELLLNIQIAGINPYQTSITKSVSQVYLPRVQPGSSVPARVDRNDPNNVLLLFETAIDPSQIPGQGGPSAVPTQVCDYCQQVFPSTETSCPNCQAPVKTASR